MEYIYLLFLSFCLYNVNIVSSIVYSCNRNVECGCSKTNANLHKIVGGESAVNSSWGWAVSLQKPLNRHFCGGSIISPLHIITAAHCITNPSEVIRDVNVVVGIDALSQGTSSMAQVRSVVRVFSHPQYNDYSKANDIAVLRLNQPLNISNEKGTARLCLPSISPTNLSNNYPVPDSSLVAIGWGKLDSYDSVIPSNRHLQQVTLKAISLEHSMCRTSIYDRKLQFCAGVIGGGKDTCQGDSGGPLMHFESTERRWVLAGITSYGRGCGLPDYAGVYTRVSVYRDWLQSIVTDHFVESTINSIEFPAGSTEFPVGSTEFPVGSTEFPVGSTEFPPPNSARSILLSYWFLALSLYVFIQK